MLRRARDDRWQAVPWLSGGHLVLRCHPLRTRLRLPTLRGSEHQQPVQEDLVR